MSKKSKTIFLIASVVVPFLLYCFYYYGMMVKNAPYKFSEFDSIHFEYGYRDSLLNKYDSKTGDYQYLNTRDSLVKMKLWLNKDDLLYLHRKAAMLGYWDFPKDETYDGKVRSPRFIIEFRYKRKTKRVTYDAAYNGDPKLKEANDQLVKEIQSKLEEAVIRQKK